LAGELDVELYIQILVWTVIGTSALWKFWEARKELHFTRSHKAAMFLLACLAISTAFSPNWKLTAFKVFQVCVLFAFTMLFVQRWGIRTTLDRIFWASIALLLLVTFTWLVSSTLMSDWSETDALRLRGGPIANVAALSTFAIVHVLSRGRRWWSFPMLCGLFAQLFFSLTRIAWGATAIVFAMAVVIRPKIGGMRYVWIACIFVVIFALFFNPLAAIDKYRPSEDAGTLTGRIPLWTFLISSTLEESPWFGIGFVSGARAVMQDIEPMLGGGHSQFVDVLVGSGVIGALAFLVLMVMNLIVATKLLKHAKRALAFEVLGLYAASFIMGLVGNEIDSTAAGFVFWTMISLLPYSLSIASAATNPTLLTLRTSHHQIPPV